MDVSYIDRIATEVEHQLLVEHRPKKRSRDLYRYYALLVLTLGSTTTLENVHDAWSAWMTAERPSHPSLVPFTELSEEQQQQDRPYMEAIHRVAQKVT
ncbi:DUF7701 domain-containing protein [Clavibacter michiganensis]|uniref:DUF7701 domain-containing protein n=1 Tax=Clavibacter michiganensis TaxID=28447 RepID=UPI003CCF51E9